MKLALIALLMTACTSCATLSGRTAIEQHNAMVRITTTCFDHEQTGSGVLISSTRILTAQHVVGCAVIPGLPIYLPPHKIKVEDGSDEAFGEVEVTLMIADVARVRLSKPLADFATPVRVGPPPQVGDMLCEAASVPRVTYRCGRAQAARNGFIGIDAMIEHGNSGSGLYDEQGRLVGIVTSLTRCEDGVICGGAGTALAGYNWLLAE